MHLFVKESTKTTYMDKGQYSGTWQKESTI